MTDEITLDAPETRLERFLAAAAGMDGITLDEPVTRIEKYLYKIAQGSGGVPEVEDADKGKYLHANESTGDLEWATAGGSGGGGVLVVEVEFTSETTATLNKTWQEIFDADYSYVVSRRPYLEYDKSYGIVRAVSGVPSENDYNVYIDMGDGSPAEFHTNSASGYPSYTFE